METRGITFGGAGSDIVNGNYYLYEDLVATGYKRQWLNTNSTILLHYNGTNWVLTDVDKTTTYYVCMAGTSNPIVDPWDDTGVWISDPDKYAGASPAPIISIFDNPNIIVEVADPIEEIDETTNTKVITTVTTYTDTLTGNVRRESEIVREKIAYTTKETERYFNFNLAVGHVYRFSFIGEFKSLGYVPSSQSVDTPEAPSEIVTTEEENENHGIYKLTRIMSYYDLISSGIDLYANLYQPLGLPKELFLHDQDNINQGCIYELVDPTDSKKLLYMPIFFIDGTPDASVEEYNRLMMVLDLGIYADPSIVAELEELVTHILLCRFGLDNTQNVNPSKLVRGDSVWMTTTDYDKLNDVREFNKQSQAASEAYGKLEERLFTAEVSRLKLVNMRLAAQVEAYEKIITKQKN